MSEHLRSTTGKVDWAADAAFLRSLMATNAEAANSITKARERLMRDGGGSSTDDIVAKLSFEFWISMLGPQHDGEWQTSLRSVFRHLDPQASRKKLRAEALEIGNLRNRIAHHEPILHLADLKERYERIIGLIRCRCPITARWARDHATFLPTLFAEPKASRKPPGQALAGMALAPVPILDPEATMADVLMAMKGRKRDFGLARLHGESLILTGDDVIAWLRTRIEAGLVDLETPRLKDLERDAFRSRVAFVAPDATSGEAMSLFLARNGSPSTKPDIIVVTDTGDGSGAPLGVVFKPDVSRP